MLVLTRKVGESILVGDCEVFVLAIEGNRVRVGVEAPKDVRIRRGETPAEPRAGGVFPGRASFTEAGN